MSGNTGPVSDIQHHQGLNGLLGAVSGSEAPPLNVDGATPALYKGANGGGRNPAAAVL